MQTSPPGLPPVKQSDPSLAGGKAIAPPASPASHKLIAFPVGSLRLAVAMNSISRVINRPKVYSSGLNAVGITTVGNRELTIVDLHQQLFGTAQAYSPERPGYLVLTPAPSGELMGIPTAETPLLLEVDSSQIRELPESYRQADTLWVASHIVRINSGEDGALQSLFLLDMAAVMARLMNQDRGGRG